MGHGSLGEVAALGELPLVVGLDQHTGREPEQGGGVGEDPDHIGPALEVGVDITYDELSKRYDAVVYTVGSRAPRRLTLPGSDLEGVIPGLDFVGWYNGHPDQRQLQTDLSSPQAVVVGQGNVALDIARMLLIPPARLERLDIPDDVKHALAGSQVREVTVMGRRGALDAPFSTSELIDFKAIPEIGISVAPVDLLVPDGPKPGAMESLRLAVLRELASEREMRERRIHLRFRTLPTRFEGSRHVEAVTFATVDSPGSLGEPLGRVPTPLVVTAIGQDGAPVPGLPFDEQTRRIPHVGGRVTLTASGEALPRTYVAGWIKRGAQGVIGSNRACARETVTNLLADCPRTSRPQWPGSRCPGRA